MRIMRVRFVCKHINKEVGKIATANEFDIAHLYGISINPLGLTPRGDGTPESTQNRILLSYLRKESATWSMKGSRYPSHCGTIENTSALVVGRGRRAMKRLPCGVCGGGDSAARPGSLGPCRP
jgi:hypothetical protein